MKRLYIDENLVSTTYRDEIKRIIEQGGNGMTQKQFLEAEIRRWKGSTERLLMLTGERYYKGDHETILVRAVSATTASSCRWRTCRTIRS